MDDTYVYWTTLGTDSFMGTVMKAPIAGGKAITVASEVYKPKTIAVDTTSLYYTTWSGQNLLKLTPK